MTVVHVRTTVMALNTIRVVTTPRAILAIVQLGACKLSVYGFYFFLTIAITASMCHDYVCFGQNMLGHNVYLVLPKVLLALIPV